MKYFYDTEFIEAGPDEPIRLISIGIVCEDGREFYREIENFPLEKCNEWVRGNVIPHLQNTPEVLRPLWLLRIELLDFVANKSESGMVSKPEFWGYYSAYDHVALCQIFGTMMDLPKGWPMYTRDLKQWADALGNPKLPEQGKGEHHALADARWNRQAYLFLEQLSASRVAAGAPLSDVGESALVIS